MPFPDELTPDGVSVLPYDSAWATTAASLVRELEALVPEATAVEHIGSTSVVGMAAKPCIDLMVVVDDLTTSMVGPSLASAGYRRRTEPWNNNERAEGRDWPKMVFAPPVGGPSCNIHVRGNGTPTTRRARLFRDYLLASPDKVALWAEFKTAVAASAPDLGSYGQIKAPAWHLLMECAEHWAEQTGY